MCACVVMLSFADKISRICSHYHLICTVFVLQVDYFDESLFDIGCLPTAGLQGAIPVTLGSISSVIENKTQKSATDIPDCNSEMPIQVPPLPEFCLPKKRQEIQQANRPSTPLDGDNFYNERSEGHYARLSEVNIHSNLSEPQSPRTSASNGLNFYVQKAAEQRVRSRSRGPSERATRARSRSARSTQGRSRSRGCSASRDIMALYTNRPVSGCRLSNRSVSPDLDSRSHLRRRTSLSPEPHTSKKTFDRPKGRTGASLAVDSKYQSSLAESVNKLNKTNYQPRKSQATVDISALKHHSNEGTSFMTLLEMDVDKSSQIEKELLAANSLKPANIKMMMIAQHKPSSSWASKDEVSVRAGEVVTGIYKQNEWLFIMNDTREFGFVPYAFTKPVKIANSEQYTNGLIDSSSTKPVSGILKTSNADKQRSRKSHPKYSVKVRTAADTDSLSSECSSAIMEDFVYTRKKSNRVQQHADCIVIDTDDICSNLDSPHNREETGTYCSDSGISDPSSNHSEDQDFLHSPVSYISENHTDSGLSTTLSTPRLPNERVVSITTEFLTSSLPSKKDSIGKIKYNSMSTISDMPLGPLGARLAKIKLEKNQGSKQCSEHTNVSSSKLRNDMKERAKSSNSTPSSLRPEIPKDYNGPRVTVVFDYDGENEDDVKVHASDIVTVLNGEDIEWIWVQRRDGREGFIPREYVIPLELSSHNRRRLGVALL